MTITSPNNLNRHYRPDRKSINTDLKSINKTYNSTIQSIIDIIPTHNVLLNGLYKYEY